jgi:hypothetical protein
MIIDCDLHQDLNALFNIISSEKKFRDSICDTCKNIKHGFPKKKL